MTRQARVAWAVVALTVALGAVHTWFFVGWEETRGGPSWPILTVGAVLMSALGALVVWRRPGHRIGWLFVLIGLSVALSNVLSVYEHVLKAEDITLARGPDVVLAWLTILLDLPVPGLILVLTFLLFPTGQLPSRRWRFLVWAAWTTFGLFALMIVAYSRPENVGAVAAPDSEFPVWFQVSTTVLVISVLLELVAAAVSVFVRLRRASSEERQQLRWLVAAAVAVAFLLAVAMFGDVVLGDSEWFRLLPLYLGLISVPVAAGLAILRYRLYDIDILLNRALVLTVLTVFVAAGYVALVVVFGAVLGQQGAESFWTSLFAFVLVALAFQPVRRFVLRFADRLVYGGRAAPYEALADFSSGVSSVPSADLLPLLAETVGRSVRARQTSVWLELPGADESPLRSATFPPPPAPPQTAPASASDVVIDVRDGVDRADRVAQIRLQVDHPLSADQRQLVDDLAQQAAMALRNLRLAAELDDRVEQLVAQTTELKLSRQRLVAARDDERHRLAGALQQAVVGHLESMPADLGRLAAAVSADPTSVDVPVALHIEAAGSALTELRTISRGLRPQPPTPRPAVLDRTRPS